MSACGIEHKSTQYTVHNVIQQWPYNTDVYNETISFALFINFCGNGSRVPAVVVVVAVAAAVKAVAIAANSVIINYVMQSKIRLYNRIQKVSLDATRK